MNLMASPEKEAEIIKEFVCEQRVSFQYDFPKFVLESMSTGYM
jgi:hypothetical protein